MRCLDLEQLESVSADAFQRQRSFQWANPVGLLYPAAFEALVESLPRLDQCERATGVSRKFGQASHDRYNLEYGPGVELSEPWRLFIEELKGTAYRRFLERMFGRDSFRVRFHWHYAYSGCSVSPHCDSAQKLGSHLFYMNSSKSWDPAWGGATLVLEDEKRKHRRSAPDFSDFESATASEFMDNASFLFQRTNRSWHGVKEIQSPPGAMRQVFIVVVDAWGLVERLRTQLLRPSVDRY
jgi:hypothetical protein